MVFIIINLLSANPTKWSNTLNLVGLALKGLSHEMPWSLFIPPENTRKPEITIPLRLTKFSFYLNTTCGKTESCYPNKRVIGLQFNIFET